MASPLHCLIVAWSGKNAAARFTGLTNYFYQLGYAIKNNMTFRAVYCEMVGQSHPRSLILVSIENAYMQVLYYAINNNLDSGPFLSCAVSEM